MRLWFRVAFWSVYFLIMTTQNHQADLGDVELKLFLDADMAILGSSSERYQEYCQQIRKEHANIPGFLFSQGRSQFLKLTIKQEQIFLSDYFREQYELNARKNIERELENLQKS